MDPMNRGVNLNISGTFHGETVIGYMNTDLPLLDRCMTVGQALDFILEKGVGERIIYFYIIDDEQRLMGVMPTRRLLITPRDTYLADIMITRMVKLPHTATVMDALELFALHRFLALPIVDGENRILGMVDVNLFTDEIIDVDGTEDGATDIFETIGFHLSQIKTASPFRVFRFRFPWLLANIASGTMCAIIAGMFEATISQSLILAFFLTMLLGLGESVSIQSMSVTIKLLAAVSPTFTWFRREFRREIVNAALLGLGCGALVAVIATVWRGFTPAAPVIGLSIVLSMVSASLIGLSVPSAIHALKLNPTIASGPITLAFADIITLFLYFGTASILL